MLIKGGYIHTMTAQGNLQGDILVRAGRIVAIEEHIEGSDETCILSAHGLTILPGLIDAHIHDGPETDPSLLCGMQAAGVTAGLIWPEKEGPCQIITTDEMKPSSIYAIEPAGYTDAQLNEWFISLANEGYQPACEIRSEKECRRILQVVYSARVKAVLANLQGCDEMLETIALSGCSVVIGVTGYAGSSPWRMANQLTALGVPVAVTCSYPKAKLRHLPLCAALCCREGASRERALGAITTAPASILRLSEAGNIVPGKRADFAIYDGDPLLLATSHVMTISGGKIRY